MNLKTESYCFQRDIWPREGRHILAQFDADSIVVYQAYRRTIGSFAARENGFGGDFSLSRMSWIKPNFLWMMFRNGWGAKSEQEITLAVRLTRTWFDAALAQAVPSSFGASNYSDQETWKRDVAASEVRLQWDPDHDPAGGKCERRAVQLGLRGEMLRQYAREAIIEIQDISEFVAAQSSHAHAPYADLLVPRERVYLPDDAAIGAVAVGLSAILKIARNSKSIKRSPNLNRARRQRRFAHIGAARPARGQPAANRQL